MEIKTADYEKLGKFYLGRTYDIGQGEMQDELVMYDSKDLVTHGVVLGMTGSGKTGLCMALLEEAAMDSIPAIVIDPKGDIPNLMLQFPELQGSDFRPWINEDDAKKKGQSPDEFAQSQADLWKNGLGQWGEDGERIRQLQQKVDVNVFTPGSTSGIPVSILSSLDAPGPKVMEDGEILAERIESTRLQPPLSHGRRWRSHSEPGTHPPLEHLRQLLEEGRKPHPPVAHPIHPETAFRQHRRRRRGRFLQREKTPGARYEDEQSAGLARLRHLAQRRPRSTSAK